MNTLNSQQQAAIEHAAGPMRIVAGAGTGKTRTLTRRFVALVESGVPEQRILALTFTTKAAAEMSGRILELLDRGHRQLHIHTFHAFCRALIDQWNRAAGLPPPAVIDDQQARAYAAEVVAQIPADALLVHHGEYNRERLARDLITLASQSRDLLMPLDSLTAYARAHEHPPGRLHDLALACNAWAAFLHENGRYNFPELGFQAVQRLKNDPDLLKGTRSRFDHVLVDEFQDTNHAQFALVRLLVPPGSGGNLCVVGDENQAIYAFRGGKPEYIAAFAQHYPGAATHHLTTNYRSGQPILDAANSLIAHNPGAAHIRLIANNEKTAAITVTPAANPDFEAEQIARGILSLVHRPEHPRRYTDIAILFRSTNLHAAPLQQALVARGIPFTVARDRAVDAEAVHDALAALRLIAGPPHWRDAARLAAHNGTPAVHLRAVESLALSDEDRDALLAEPWAGHNDFTPAQQQAIEAARSIAARAATLRSLPLPDLTYQALVLTGRLDDRLKPETARTLASFIKDATTVQDSGGDAEALVTHLAAGYDDLPHQAQTTGAGVQILTVHSAKGLEWPVVFLAGMANGQFPLPMRQDETFDFDTLGDWRDGNDTRLTEAQRQQRFLQEERRLAYVAITRAQSELHISYPVRGESGSKLSPSPFIHEAGLAHLAANAPVFDSNSPPASMTDLAAQLRTRRNQALNAPLDAPDIAQHLANLLLDQWAAMGTVPGSTAIRDRRVPDPHTPETSLDFSYTALNTYDSCPRQYLYARVLKLQDPEHSEAPSRSAGAAVHAALEELNRLWQQRGAPPEDAEVVAAIARHWPERGFEFAAQSRQLRMRSEAMLRRYYAWERSRSPRRAPIATEYQFEAAYGPHQIRGVIDAVMQAEDGAVEIVDYKVSKYDNRNLKETESLQLFLYDYAWRRQNAAASPAVAFYALRHKDDTGFVTQPEWVDRQVKSMTHTEETRLAFTTSLDGLIDGIVSNDFTPKPAYETCSGCVYRWLCPEG